MLREPVIITEPTVEPVSVAEFKDWRRIDFTDEDYSVIPQVLKAARVLFEKETGRTLHQTVWEWYLERWPSNFQSIRLPKAAPLISVSTIAYKGTDGIETVWSSTEWIASTRTLPGRILPGYGYQYPTTTLYPLDPIRIRYSAGIANGSPQLYPDERIRTAIMEIASSLYEYREPHLIGMSLRELPISKLSIEAQALLDSSRVEYF